MEETLEILQDNLGQALIDTAYMVVVSAIIGVAHTAALFRCSTGKQQILGYGSFSCINVSKNS